MPLVDFFCETCAQPRLLGWWGQLKRALSRELTQLTERRHVTAFIAAAFLDPQSDVDLPPPPPQKEAEPPPHSGGGGRGGEAPSAPSPPSPTADPSPRFGVSTEQEELLEQELRSLNAWGLNIFRVAQLSNGRSLSCIVYSVFQERGLPRRFSIPLPVLLRFSRALELRYRRDVAYHCSLHAADVLHAAHVLLRCTALRAVFSDLEVLAALFAAAIHDVDHPGVTNQFLISTNSALAQLYDRSPLEQHHVAVGFRLLRGDGCDIFQNLSRAQRRRLRHIVTDVVLATDMAQHGALLADLRAVVRAKQLTDSGGLRLHSDGARIQVLRAVVHCADLSNPTRALGLYRQWSGRIMEELFRQGDRERQRGMEVSAMCDRGSACVERAQVCFIEEVAQPLWEAWAALVQPEAQEMLQELQRNHEWYRQRIPPPPGNDPHNDPPGNDPPPTGHPLPPLPPSNPLESSSELS